MKYQRVDIVDAIKLEKSVGSIYDVLEFLSKNSKVNLSNVNGTDELLNLAKHIYNECDGVQVIQSENKSSLLIPYGCYVFTQDYNDFSVMSEDLFKKYYKLIGD